MMLKTILAKFCVYDNHEIDADKESDNSDNNDNDEDDDDEKEKSGNDGDSSVLMESDKADDG